MQLSEHKTVVILVTDIVGSSTLWDTLGDAFRPALDLHDQLMLNLIEATRGYALRSEGDGFRAMFNDVADAVRFGVLALASLQRATWPTALPGGLAVRFGVHVGVGALEHDPVSGRLDVRGREMARAERVADAANGGQILLSEAARRDLELGRLARLGLPDLRVKELGRYILNGLGETATLATVVGGGLGPNARLEPRAERAPAVPTNRPPRAVVLHGRDGALDELRATMARRSSILLIQGPPGVGKSALMDAWMGALLSPDSGGAAPAGGVWRVELADAHDAASTLDAVATALRLPTGPAAASALRSHLASLGPAVLGLDNVERAREAIAALLPAWRAAAPELRVVVTSRAPLPGLDPPTLRLPPLETPAPTPEAIAASPAGALFLNAAQAAQPAFTVRGPQDARDVATVIRLVGGLPLGIEIAASRLRLLSLRQLASRMARGLLETLGGGATPTRDLAAQITRSWEILAPWERLALAQLSVFRGPMTVAAAQEVICTPADAPTPTSILSSLEAQGLLMASPGADDEPRLSLLAPVVGWARARARSMAETPATAPFLDAAIRRYAGRFAHMGDRDAVLALSGPQGARCARALILAHADLRAAFRWAMKESEQALAAGAARALVELYALRGPLDDAIMLRPVADLPSLPAADRAWLCWRIGWTLCLGGHLSLAQDCLEQSRALAQQAEDHGTLAGATRSLGVLRAALGQAEPALILAEQALADARAHDDPVGEGLALVLRADLRGARREAEAAADHLAALAILRARSRPRHLAYAQVHHARFLCDRGALPEALRCGTEALAVFEAMGDDRNAGLARAVLGLIQWARGEDLAARETLTRAEADLQRVGVNLGGPERAWILALVHLRQDRVAEASAAVDEALRRLAILPDDAVSALTLGLRAELVARQGDEAAARALFDQAARQSPDDPCVRALVVLHGIFAARALGHPKAPPPSLTDAPGGRWSSLARRQLELLRAPTAP